MRIMATTSMVRCTFDLEPEAVRNLRAADVLIIGNSRAQVVFSTSAVDAFAEAHGWRVYRLGFGYDEELAFPEHLIRRYRLQPRMIIVNADPFFTGNGSKVSNPLLSGYDQPTAYIHSLIQRLAQHMQRATCGANILTSLTCGKARATYRSTHRRNTGTSGICPMPGDFRWSLTAPAIWQWRHTPSPWLRQFLAVTGLPPKCLLLTVVPSNFATPLLTQQVAAHVGSRWFWRLSTDCSLPTKAISVLRAPNVGRRSFSSRRDR